jgi:hypothetical protein
MAETASKPNPKAELAFADYVAMGSGRSLRALCESYHVVPTQRFETLGKWSSEYQWQARIEQAATARSDAMLKEASDLDAETFLQSSRLLNDRMKYATREHADAIVKMRESVRKPAPKGGSSVNVNVSVEVRTLAEQIAKATGIDAEELLREAEKIANAEWAKVA